MSYERRYKAIGAKTVFDDLATPLADRIAFIDEDETIDGNWTFENPVTFNQASNAFTDAAVRIVGNAASIWFEETDQATDDAIWTWGVGSRAFRLRTFTGAGGVGMDAFVALRNSDSTDIASVTLNADQINLNGDLTLQSDTDGVVADFGSETDGTDEFKFLRVKSSGYAGIRIVGDWGNTGGEPGGAFVELQVDGEGVLGNGGFFSFVNAADTDGLGNAFTGTTGNSILIGSQLNRRILFGHGGQTNFIMRLNVGTAASFYIREVGNSDAGTVPGFGQLWVRSSDGKLMFTDSSGNTTAIT